MYVNPYAMTLVMDDMTHISVQFVFIWFQLLDDVTQISVQFV